MAARIADGKSSLVDFYADIIVLHPNGTVAAAVKVKPNAAAVKAAPKINPFIRSFILDASLLWCETRLIPRLQKTWPICAGSLFTASIPHWY